MPGFGRFSLVILAVISGACTQPPVGPEPLEFEADPYILRGTWLGEEVDGKDNPLLLYLKASLPTRDGYQVIGFFSRGVFPETGVIGSVSVPLMPRAADVTAQQSPACAASLQSPSSAQFGGPEIELCGSIPTGSPSRFELTLTERYATGAVYTYTFLMTRQPGLADPNLLVRGKLVYAQDEPSTGSEPFEFTEDSHAIVQLWWWTGPSVADAPEELIAEVTLEDISSFPIEYRLEGDAERIFARRGEYVLNVGVFSGDGGVSSERFAVGDLTNETYILVPNPGAEVQVELTSLESCSRPDADGSCIP